MDLIIAPLQGFTDCFWRQAHNEVMAANGFSAAYCAPFVRFEKGVVRRRDLADILPDANAGADVLPQAIFGNGQELMAIVQAIKSLGYSRVNLNFGCPFAPQVKAGRGAGALRPEMMAVVGGIVAANPDIKFSIKMRTGVCSHDEWSVFADAINAMPLEFVAVHPRTAAQGYRGEVDAEVVGRMASAICHRLFFNGDITWPGQAEEIMQAYPALAGVMMGRGVLMRPSLPLEIASGTEWHPGDRAAVWLDILADVTDRIASVSYGDAQALNRLKPRLEYACADVDRRLVKALKKSHTLAEWRRVLCCN